MVLKEMNERLVEVISIRRKLESVGLSKQIPRIKEFCSVLNTYVRDGKGRSGKFRIPDTNRILEYILPSNARHQCSVTLKYQR